MNDNYNLTSHDDLVSNGNHSLNKLNNVEHALILLMNDPNYYNYQFIKDTLLNIQLLKKNLLSINNNNINNLHNLIPINSINNTSNLTPINTSNLTPVNTSNLTPINTSNLIPINTSNLTPINTSNLTPVDTGVNSITSGFNNLLLNSTNSKQYRNNYTYIKYNFFLKNDKTKFISIKYNINSKNNYYLTNNDKTRTKVYPNVKNIYINKFGIHFDGKHISFLDFFNDNKDHILEIKKNKDKNDLYENIPNQH